MSQPPHQPPDGSSWNPPPGPYGPPPGQSPGQYGPPPGQYGPPPGQYGPPPGQFGGPPPGANGGGRGGGNGKVIGIVAGVVALVAAVVLVLVFTVFRGDDDTRAEGSAAAVSSAQASEPSSAAGQSQGSSSAGSTSGEPREPGPLVDPTAPPDGLGDDATLDDLAQSCFDGDMQSCDDLFLESDVGSAYETYGDTCAGRQPAGTDQYCTVTFPDA